MLISYTINLIVGICLFLIGIYFLTSGMHQIVSKTAKVWLIKFNINPLFGVIIGIIVTALLQSSSGTTVILISLVESKVLSLKQATPIIMGANIGTTVTGQLTAFSLGNYVVIIFIAACLFGLVFRKKYTAFSITFFGFSLVFLGLDFLTKGFFYLQDLNILNTIFLSLENNPVSGLLSGFLLTAVIQSSGTAVAILQSLGANNIISVTSAIVVLFGLNIGTCVTTIIASIPLSRTGKRAALIHLLFNILGTVLCFPLIHLLVKITTHIAPYDIPRQIAHAHSLFNIISTFLLLPFIPFFIWFSYLVIKDKKRPLNGRLKIINRF
ncbi:Na/Pi symporter [Serpentinicella sp. ANB-PHB4]|uniref:Na/Pi cotransporter family protein n=1 Tax=Serpentinicella sp. ANB-PHB4 TaxID=3074076 RepID=UPI00285E5EB2|nr:Na/Pi symporter [Serpentinicella sp. ANB-PHB4]MDR5659385.1 Na/Pi symporter [Serpentinicella sp. ANB-PHB4]